MYDEDNSREIDIHEMERVMKVSNQYLDYSRTVANNQSSGTRVGTWNIWTVKLFHLLCQVRNCEYLAKFGSDKISGQYKSLSQKGNRMCLSPNQKP